MPQAVNFCKTPGIVRDSRSCTHSKTKKHRAGGAPSSPSLATRTSRNHRAVDNRAPLAPAISRAAGAPTATITERTTAPREGRPGVLDQSPAPSVTAQAIPRRVRHNQRSVLAQTRLQCPVKTSKIRDVDFTVLAEAAITSVRSPRPPPDLSGSDCTEDDLNRVEVEPYHTQG
jgi:hypothetical protein